MSRSSTICEIETFITLESSVMTNCAAARITIGVHLPIDVIIRNRLIDAIIPIE